MCVYVRACVYLEVTGGARLFSAHRLLYAKFPASAWLLFAQIPCMLHLLRESLTSSPCLMICSATCHSIRLATNHASRQDQVRVVAELTYATPR